MTATLLYLGTAAALIVLGLGAMLLKRNLIKMIIGFSLVDTGLHLLLVALGHLPGGTAPIVDDQAMFASADSLLVRPGALVDPVVQAMVLTAIVIGVGTTALMLAYAVRIYARKGTLDIGELRRLKW